MLLLRSAALTSGRSPRVVALAPHPKRARLVGRHSSSPSASAYGRDRTPSPAQTPSRRRCARRIGLGWRDVRIAVAVVHDWIPVAGDKARAGLGARRYRSLRV